MPSQKLTLADYLQRQEAIRNPNRYQGFSEAEKERIEYFQAKKKKVGILLNDIMYTVKKSVQSPEEYAKIEKMIRAASEEIKIQFENTKQFTQDKAQGELNNVDTQPDLSRISLDKKCKAVGSSQQVLKESNRMSQILMKQEATNGTTRKQCAKQNSKVH